MDILISLLPQEVTSALGVFLTVLTLAFYFAECCMGYKLIRSWISVLGFCFGAIAGFRIVEYFTHQAGYAILGAIVGGILLSVLSYRIYLIGIFLIAAYGLYQIGITLIPLNGVFLFIASTLLGLAAGYLAIKYMRPAIILITAFHGGVMAASLLPQFIAIPSGISTTVLGLILGAIGTLIQFLTSKK